MQLRVSVLEYPWRDHHDSCPHLLVPTLRFSIAVEADDLARSCGTSSRRNRLAGNVRGTWAADADHRPEPVFRLPSRSCRYAARDQLSRTPERPLDRCKSDASAHPDSPPAAVS